MRPWWLGFKGPVQLVSDGVWQTKGLYTFDDAKKIVTITELPVGTWTSDYKAFLDEMCVAGTSAGAKVGGSEGGKADNSKTDDGKPVLKNFDDLYTHITVKFNLELDGDYYDEIRGNPVEFEKRYKLTSTWRTTNMVAFDAKSKIVKYGCVGDILEAFYVTRLSAYEARRAAEIERLRAEAVEADAKARFLQAVLDGTIDMRRASDEDIVAAMIAHELPALSGNRAVTNVDAYDYLLRLRMDRVKAAAVEELTRAVVVAKQALEALEATTAGAMWLSDLAEFEVAWKKMRAEREAALEGKGQKPKAFKVKPKAKL